MGNIVENLDEVRYRIEKACDSVGRKKEEVTLIAVSKTKPISDILTAYDYSQRDFGENKVVELIEKQAVLPDAKWHMIGHLQRNKVKKVLDKITLLHSLDSLDLAVEIQKYAEKLKLDFLDTLIEINIAGEESKFGIDLNKLPYFVDELLKYNKIRIRGLMCVAPNVKKSDENRALFCKMREIMLDISYHLPHNSHIDILSMGMSNDFEAAIKEGATMVRIGSDIFGRREYNSN